MRRERLARSGRDRQLLGLPLQPRPIDVGRRVAVLLGVALLFVGLTAYMTYPQVSFLGTGVSPDVGDPLLSTWRLSWIAHQIVRDPMHLFDANIFYPSRHTLAFSDAMLAPALTVAPLVWLGVPQLFTYNLLFLSGFVFSGIGMFILVRSLTGNIGAALVAGFVFAFLPFRFIHYAHLELQMAQWMPLCLWALHRTIEQRAPPGRVADRPVLRAAGAVLAVLRDFSGNRPRAAGGRPAAGAARSHRSIDSAAGCWRRARRASSSPRSCCPTSRRGRRLVSVRDSKSSFTAPHLRTTCPRTRATPCSAN